MSVTDNTTRRCAVRLLIKGVVQGVGFRPFVYRLARRHDIAGWVINGEDGVHVVAEGSDDAVERFVAAVRDDPPPAAHVASFSMTNVARTGFERFEIRASTGGGSPTVRVSPDLATCDACANCSIRPTGALAIRTSTAPTAGRGTASSSRCRTIVSAPRCVTGPFARNAAASTKTLPTGVFTPSRWLVPHAGQTYGWKWEVPSSEVARRSGELRSCSFAARSWPSRESAAIIWHAMRGILLPSTPCANASSGKSVLLP